VNDRLLNMNADDKPLVGSAGLPIQQHCPAFPAGRLAGELIGKSSLSTTAVTFHPLTPVKPDSAL
jgi:hypothetical protein